MEREIRIAAALICDDDMKVLLVRKKGSPWFMQAGGKRADNETPRQALSRELKEELGLSVEGEQMMPFGLFQAPAANEAGHIVVADVFRITLPHQPLEPRAEIEEVVWLPVEEARLLPLAPLTGDCILPLLGHSDEGVAR